MKRLHLRVTALSPLAIRSDHAPQGVKTTHYVPGMTLSGALAASHRMLRPEQEEEFAALFLRESISFPYLYPASFQHPRFQTYQSPIMPVPKTAQSCKRFSGFPLLEDEEKVEEYHGVRDSLLDWGIFAMLNNEASSIPELLTPLRSHVTCPYINEKTGKGCNHPMDHFSGFYRRNQAGQRKQAEVKTRLQTHTGINREWGTVQEGVLYNREVIDETMQFWGELWIPAELERSFKQFLNEASTEDVIRLGTGRTRGLGAVSIQAEEAPTWEPEPFKRKLTLFNEAFQKRTQEAGIQQRAPFYFAITLHSPAILCDPFLCYLKTITPQALAERTGLPAHQFQCIYQSTGVQRITGWYEVWGTPRTTEYAIEMGSVFLFASSAPLDEELIQALATLEQTGIGKRRNEGFGRVCISDPFHLEADC
uniref:CRISPR type III-associated protein domain-containing protein n=1 Tax=Thermosporothrix sp. COM3 TaxID=2490863 RepID=A0A455SNC3_9CHLR|nr:hypothetical protein KTC_24660 [Thermosporothrix sp. COM3]